MATPPRVFIGSSSEASNIVVALQTALDDAIDPHPWLDAFNLSEHPLEDLIHEAANSEFAIFVFAPDDHVESRGRQMTAPRDNVVFELGLFRGILGHGRVFVVKAEGESVKVPSDLAGLSFSKYKVPEVGASNRKWVTALRPAAAEIKDGIARELARPSRVDTPAPHRDLAGASGLLDAAAVVDARRGHLQGLSDVVVGAAVVHGLHGVGQVVGFDPPGDGDVRFVRVRFSGGLASLPQEELFDPASHER